MYTFKSMALENVPWAALDNFEDRIIYQTLPWLKFLEKTQQAKPVIVEISHDRTVVGYLTLMSTKKMTLRILGSPFHGWTTGYLGFNLVPGQSRGPILKALPQFLADEFGCHYFQLGDYYLEPADYDASDYAIDHYQNFELDLSRSEDDIFKNMRPDGRQKIRKSARNGVLFEEAQPDGFAEEYYSQLRDVFDRHRLVPTYGIERVTSLIDCLHPTGNLLLARAKSPEGESIATGIYASFNKTAFAWGWASWRQYHYQYSPNEGLMWFAIKHLKNRGCTWFDMGGWASYKKKYGTMQVTRPYLMRSQPGFLVPCKALAMKGWYLCHKSTSRLRLLARQGRASGGEGEE